MNVIDLAAVRAARKAAACTFEIFGELRRPASSDVVIVAVLGDWDITTSVFQQLAEARDAADGEIQSLPVELIHEEDGRYWLEGYVRYERALALRDLCLARGLSIQAA